MRMAYFRDPDFCLSKGKATRSVGTTPPRRISSLLTLLAFARALGAVRAIGIGSI